MMRRDRNQQFRLQRAYRTLGLIGAGITAGAIAYASLIEPRSLLIRHLSIACQSLPHSLDGLRLAFLSDFHIGGPGNPLLIANQAISVLKELRPDLILLGGDYYDRGVRVPDEPEWGVFPEIAPTLAVPGNHDYKMHPEASEQIFELLDNAGIIVLRNQSRLATARGDILRIIGLDDPYTGRADFQAARRDDPEDGVPTIMLAHAGLVADSLPIGSADLILSGHTHGAQVRFSPFRHTGPLDIFWWLDKFHGNPISPYRQGLFRVRGALLYTGNGLGTTSLGMRFLAPPEVTVLTLRASDGDPERACDDPARYLLHSKNERIWHQSADRESHPTV